MAELDTSRRHKYHKKFKDAWEFQVAAYEGADAMLEAGVLQRNERETENNHAARKKEAFSFEYSKAIVDLLVDYLFEKDGKREFGDLAEDELWKSFVGDCDLFGTALDDFLVEQERYVGAYGMVGILIDKPQAKAETRADEKKAGLYPYLTVYHPPFILDWSYDRKPNGRPFLSELLLQDEDGLYRLWTPTKWEVWEVKNGSNGKATLKESGDNPLGEIPFVWLMNKKSRFRNIGVSDIGGIARIDASIMRDLSHGQEIIKYNAFPMMRMPMKRGGSNDKGEEVVAATAVLEFDPKNGADGKPDWLEAECLQPIEAILKWNGVKKDEIYRSANVGGTGATEVSDNPKSGVAMKTEFRQLNARLATKGRNLEKAERAIVNFWCMWQDIREKAKDVVIERPRDFSVENLAAELEDLLTSKSIVGGQSPTFSEAVARKVVRAMLPNASEETLAQIDKELGAADLGPGQGDKDGQGEG